MGPSSQPRPSRLVQYYFSNFTNEWTVTHKDLWFFHNHTTNTVEREFRPGLSAPSYTCLKLQCSLLACEIFILYIYIYEAITAFLRCLQGSRVNYKELGIASSAFVEYDLLPTLRITEAILSISFNCYKIPFKSVPLGDLPDPEIEPVSPALQADSLPAEPSGKTLESVILFL